MTILHDLCLSWLQIEIDVCHPVTKRYSVFFSVLSRGVSEWQENTRFCSQQLLCVPEDLIILQSFIAVFQLFFEL